MSAILFWDTDFFLGSMTLRNFRPKLLQVLKFENFHFQVKHGWNNSLLILPQVLLFPRNTSVYF